MAGFRPEADLILKALSEIDSLRWRRSSGESRLQRALECPLKADGRVQFAHGAHHMFELKRTMARAAFKDLLGQANHFLITILVGLSGVRSEHVGLDKEFSTSWNPRDVRRSADRSRVFVLDLGLVRAVDAFDTYLMRTRRRPMALASEDFAARMDGTGQKVSKRLEVFSTFLPPLALPRAAFLRLAFDWRNRRVHSLADDNLDRREIKILIEAHEVFREEFGGLDVNDLVKHYQAGDAPTFKETAAIIRLVHGAVEHFDGHLLSSLDIEDYIRACLADHLSPSSQSAESFASACRLIWGSEKKRNKVLRTLRFVGVHEVPEVTARRVPDQYVELLLSMSPLEAVEYLRPEAFARQ